MLSRTLHHLTTSAALKGYRPRPQGMSITHLMFADDLLLVAKASRRNAMLFKKVVIDYLNQSGQKVNMQKSHIQLSKCIEPMAK